MKTLWALPGFLGLPKDWEIFSWEGLIGVDLHAFSMRGLDEWAVQFNDWVEEKKKGPAVLMGYSLGGRLALHALIDRPQLWQGAIIVSAHYGLGDRCAREERLQADGKWAARFQTEEWTSLMEAWNEREVFAGDRVKFDRYENDYRREALSRFLVEGSLGRQVDLRAEVAHLPMPLLWVNGSKDFRFCKIANELRFRHPLSHRVVISEAGHRAPWSQPAVFEAHVQAFLQSIEGGCDAV